jgi:hypothetical protein
MHFAVALRTTEAGHVNLLLRFGNDERTVWPEEFMKILFSVLVIPLATCINLLAYDFQWATAFPGGGSGVKSIALDGESNTLAAGWFSGTVSFGTNQLSSVGNQDLFVAKLNSTGGVLWVKQFGSDTGEDMDGLARANDGSVFVLGKFTGTLTAGTNTATAISSNGYLDAFVVKLNPSGEFVWLRSYALEFHGPGGGITVSPDHKVWITAQANGALFIRSYDFSGNVLHHFTPTTSTSRGHGIVVGTNGNIYVTGYFEGSLDLGTTNMAGGGGPSSHFTAAFNSGGTALWTTRIPSFGYSFGNAITLTPQGDVITVGRIDVSYIGAPYPTLFIEKHSPAGQLIWSRQQGAHRSVFTAESVAVDSAGNAYTGGEKRDPFTFPDPRSGPLFTAWTPAGTQAVFLRVIGSAPIEGGSANGIAIAADGSVHVGGAVSGTFQFGNFTVSGTNGFVAKLAPLMHPRLLITSATNYITLEWPGAASGFSLQQIGRFSGASWSNVTPFATTISNRARLTLPASEAESYFRLSGP